MDSMAKMSIDILEFSKNIFPYSYLDRINLFIYLVFITFNKVGEKCSLFCFSSCSLFCQSFTLPSREILKFRIMCRSAKMAHGDTRKQTYSLGKFLRSEWELNTKRRESWRTPSFHVLEGIKSIPFPIPRLPIRWLPCRPTRCWCPDSGFPHKFRSILNSDWWWTGRKLRMFHIWCRSESSFYPTLFRKPELVYIINISFYFGMSISF